VSVKGTVLKEHCQGQILTEGEDSDSVFRLFVKVRIVDILRTRKVIHRHSII
jgi:hypothetical protein